MANDARAALVKAGFLWFAGLSTACGGGGTDSPAAAAAAAPTVTASASAARTLTCVPNERIEVPTGALINNMWNEVSAGAQPHSQCLQVRDYGSALEYGWAWNWPASDGIYAYPEMLVGASPWLADASNDARFPRTVESIRSMALSYQLLTTSTGKQAGAADFWFTATNLVASVDMPTPVKAELLIWTNVSAGVVNSSDVPIDVIEIDGKRWTVYMSLDHRDVSHPDDPNRWTLISYVAVENSQASNYDARKFFQDAIGRGVIKATDYVSGVEIGHEVISGSGSSWLRNFSLTVN